MPEITLFQYEISPYADKVRRTLKLKGLDYSVQEIVFSQAKKWKTVSPTGKFPAMEYDGTVIVDSTDIIRFLDEKHPNPSLTPSNAKSHALAHILEDWADESLYFYDLAIRSKPNNVDFLVEDVARHETGLSRKMMNWVLPKGAQKIASTQGLGRKDSATLDREINNHFIALEALLETDQWLCGDKISFADIAVASMIWVLIRAEEPAAALPNHKKLYAWHKRIDEMTL